MVGQVVQQPDPVRYPVTVRCEDTIDDTYGDGGPSGVPVGVDNFSARWNRTYTLAAPRILRITGGSDDGIRIRVDGTLVINDWVDRGFTERTVDTATLPAGDHEISVEYYENAGGAAGEGHRPGDPAAGQRCAERNDHDADEQRGRHGQPGEQHRDGHRQPGRRQRRCRDPEHGNERVAAG